VQPLLGGLNGWIDLGKPVVNTLLSQCCHFAVRVLSLCCHSDSTFNMAGLGQHVHFCRRYGAVTAALRYRELIGKTGLTITEGRLQGLYTRQDDFGLI
jgi:hypothetical protein